MRSRKEIDAIPIFFIVGKGRSGTTMLQSILDAHPACIIPLETRFIIHLKSKYRSVSVWTDSRIRSFYNDLFTDLKFSTLWQVDKHKLLQELLFLGKEADFASLVKVVYLNYLSIYPKSEIKLIGDKNPIYTIFIPQLAEIFPDAKFIHLIRDHRDNISSHIRVFPIQDIPFLASKWVFYNQLVEDHKRRNPEQVLTIRYEDLVSDPGANIQRICSFLGITYDPAMLRFHERTNEGLKYIEHFVRKFHDNLYNPINNSKVNTWKKGLSPDQVQAIEVIAGLKAAEYGYHSEIPATKGEQERAYTHVKIKVWYHFVHNYYRLPLFLREFASSVFRIVFGNDYKKKKELFTSDNK